jgi:hypothetical protein
MNTQKLSALVRSAAFAKVMLSVAALAVLAFAFRAGMEAGYRRAELACRFDQSFYRVGQPRPRAFFGDTPDTHGAVGEIETVNLPTFVVEDNGREKVVRIDDDTDIMSASGPVEASELTEGQMVIVIGAPNDDAEVVAKLVRVMPKAAPLPAPAGGSAPAAPLKK